MDIDAAVGTFIIVFLFGMWLVLGQDASKRENRERVEAQQGSRGQETMADNDLKGAEPGWYLDPDDPASLSYWTGEYWIDRPRRNEHDTAPELASPGKRLGAFLLDAVLLWVAFFPLVMSSIVLSSLSDTGFILAAPLLLAAVLFVFLYPILSVGWLGQTYGKHLLGIKVIDERTGRAIGGWAALGRKFMQAIGTYFFGLGLLWTLWDHKNQGWHDKAVNSIVVDIGVTRHDNPWQHLIRLWEARSQRRWPPDGSPRRSQSAPEAPFQTRPRVPEPPRPR